MSSQCGELWPTSSWDRLASLGHASKFQQVSCFGFITALLRRCSTESTKLCTMFGRLLGWYIIYTFSCPLTEFCHVQNSPHVQLLRSPIGSVTTALQQRASAKLCGKVQWNYGTSAHGATYIRLGGHHVGHWPTFLVWCPKDQVLMTCLGWAVDHCASISLTAVVCAVRTNDKVCHCAWQHEAVIGNLAYCGLTVHVTNGPAVYGKYEVLQNANVQANSTELHKLVNFKPQSTAEHWTFLSNIS